MIELLISVLILLIVFGVLFYIIRLLPLPEPFGTIALLILALVLLLVLLGYVLPLGGYHRPLL